MKDRAKTRILFVDDEAAILELFELTVAGMKGEWETCFAESGETALRLMEKEPFDLVISDMRMPGMTGAQLLNEVMKRYPATGRIILSGYTEQEDIWRCVGATHQFLAKPCDLPSIQATLNRMRGLRDRLPSEEIKKALVRSGSLPSVPEVYFDLLAAVQDPSCPTGRIAEIVASDPALTARMLQLVNSAFFGCAREVSSVNEAVMMLGLGTIRTLALTTKLFSTLQPRSAEWSAERVWHHSLRVGQWAKRLIELEDGDDQLAEQAFTAGVLHDVGKLLLAENVPAYIDLVTRAEKENRLLVELEHDAFGATHADVGAYLLDLWGLPAPLVEAVALHHEPAKTGVLKLSPLTAVHVASVLENAAQHKEANAVLDRLDSLYLDQLGLGSRVPVWRRELVTA